jgi:hypothetical protein
VPKATRRVLPGSTSIPTTPMSAALSTSCKAAPAALSPTRPQYQLTSGTPGGGRASCVQPAGPPTPKHRAKREHSDVRTGRPSQLGFDDHAGAAVNPRLLPLHLAAGHCDNYGSAGRGPYDTGPRRHRVLGGEPTRAPVRTVRGQGIAAARSDGRRRAAVANGRRRRFHVTPGRGRPVAASGGWNRREHKRPQEKDPADEPGSKCNWVSASGRTGSGSLPIVTGAANILRCAALAGDITADSASLLHGDVLGLRVKLGPYALLAERCWQLRENVTIYETVSTSRWRSCWSLRLPWISGSRVHPNPGGPSRRRSEPSSADAATSPGPRRRPGPTPTGERADRRAASGGPAVAQLALRVGVGQRTRTKVPSSTSTTQRVSSVWATAPGQA